eukprot:scaffold400354_cov32-Prasinocladus_malaysianus.AAC.1
MTWIRILMKEGSIYKAIWTLAIRSGELLAMTMVAPARELARGLDLDRFIPNNASQFTAEPAAGQRTHLISCSCHV